MASGTLSDDQAIFSLAMMANLSANGIGPAGLRERELAATLRLHFANLQPQLGAWELVWGPVIREAVGELIAGNTMFVARDLDRPSRLVVSIAGTNPFSAFDWLVEDFFVSGQVGWRFGSPSPASWMPASSGPWHRPGPVDHPGPGPRSRLPRCPAEARRVSPCLAAGRARHHRSGAQPGRGAGAGDRALAARDEVHMGPGGAGDAVVPRRGRADAGQRRLRGPLRRLAAGEPHDPHPQHPRRRPARLGRRRPGGRDPGTSTGPRSRRTSG